MHTSLEARGGGSQRAQQEIWDELHASVVRLGSLQWSHNEPGSLFFPFLAATQIDKNHAWIRYLDHVNVQVVVLRIVHVEFCWVEGSPRTQWLSATRSQCINCNSLSWATRDHFWEIPSGGASPQTRRALLSLSKGHEEVGPSDWNAEFPCTTDRTAPRVFFFETRTREEQVTPVTERSR